MTIRTISIPFDTRRTKGILNVPVLSKQEFCKAASQVEEFFLKRFHAAKPLFYGSSKNSYLFLPLKTTLNQLTAEHDEGLKFVCEDNRLWLGFIPFPNLAQRAGHPLGLGRLSMRHYRLDDIENLKRLNPPSNKVSVFSLPCTAKLQQIEPNQLCSILNISFLLILNYEQDKCSLLCCNGPLLPEPFVPIFCRKQIDPDIPCALLEQGNSLAVPFLAGKRSGIIYFPILLLDQWNKDIIKNPPKNVSKSILHSTLIVFPTSASFKSSQELKGLKCVLLQGKDNCLNIGFLPTIAGNKSNNKHYHKSYDNFFKTLFEIIPSRSKNYHLFDDACASVTLPSFVSLKAGMNVNILELKGYSLFLLASEDGRTCGLFCMNGDFELKCTRPTHPNEGVFPIKRLLEQSSSEEPPEKRARVEEQGETSQRAVEESRRAEEGETSQRAVEESRRAEEGETSQKAVEKKREFSQIYRLRPMTIRTISIPFDARRTKGVLNVPVLSKQEFCKAASQVEEFFLKRFHAAKPLFYGLSKNSYLFLPLKTTLNQLIVEHDEGLKFVCEDNRLWLGFIPFLNLVQRAEDPRGSGRNSMQHYRLNDIADLKRLNPPSNKVSVFSLPCTAKLQQIAPNQLCSILNISFLLILSYEQDKCSLLCCDGILLPEPFVPILCRKQIKPDVPCASLEQGKNLAVPFLAGKRSGTIHFPILLLDQWNKEIRKNPPKNVSKPILNATLIAFPTSASFKPSQGLQGLKCVLLQGENNCLNIGFLPTIAGNKSYNKHYCKSYDNCFTTLLEIVPSRSRNHHLSDDACASVTLPSFVSLKAGANVNILKLKGYSLFLLASEDGRTCSLFCMSGDFKLKCTRPTHPNEGVFPIRRLLDQSLSEDPSEKRDRVEEQGESSQRAIKESRRTKRARRAEEARREEKARREEETSEKAVEEQVESSQIYRLRPMIIRTISIPFDTRRTKGVLNVPVLSKQEFYRAARQVKKLFFKGFHAAKPIFDDSSKNSYLFLPLKTNLNQLTAAPNEGLKFVCEGNQLWIGFIPFSNLAQFSEHPLGLGKQSMHHYRLDDLANLKRLNVPRNKVSVFSLPYTAKLQQIAPNQLCSILNISFLLILNYEQDKCSLLCCDGTLLSEPFVPIFCRKQIKPDVPCASLQDASLQGKNLAVPFLAGKRSGTIHFPILLLDQWNKKITKKPPKNFRKFILNPTLIVFPTSASFKSSQGLQGLKCFLLQGKNNYLNIGFLPTIAGNKSNKHYCKSYDNCFTTLLEIVPSRSKNHHLSDDACNSVALPSFVSLKAGSVINTLELKGYSLFLLASEDSRTCGLFCMSGDFELKCTRPTHPNEGFFPIKRLLEQSSLEEPSEKRARVEEQGESSQKAVEESIRAEEARKECAAALMLFSQQE